VSVFAVVDETGFKTGFYAGNNTLVNIAFPLFTARCFNVNVDKFLAVDNCDPQLF